MAVETNKPNFQYVWASGGAKVAPSGPKIQEGWVAEVPPFQWENWSQNRQDEAILHLFQKGISEWDALSNYYFTTSGVRSYVQGSDGQIYVAVQDSLGQNPTTDTTNTYWVKYLDQLQTTGTQGAFKNMSSSTTGSSAVVTFTADEIIVKNSSNIYKTLRSISITASTGAASGVANSLDTGTWAFSTWYARHVIYNPTTSTTAILWSLSKTAPTLPSGYTFWAFTGQWERTQSATNFNPLAMQWNGHRGSYIKGTTGNVTVMPIMATGAIGAPGTPTYAPIAWANFAPPDTYELDLLARAGTPGTSVVCAPNNTFGVPANTTGNAPPIAYVPQGGANSPLSIRQWMPVESSNIYYASDDVGFSILQCYGFNTKG